MSNQPEALRLADAIDPLKRYRLDNLTCAAAAACLRRLHAEIEALHRINQAHEMKLSVRGYEIQIADLSAEIAALKAERDALLRALSALGIRPMPNQQGRWLSKHRPGLNFPSAEAAAIDKAEGGGNG